MGGKDSKLSYITHEEALRRVSEAELKRLKDAFKRVSTVNGFMSENAFMREVLWDGVPQKIAQLLFKAFGGTSKGLSYKELLAGLVVLTKGTREEKMKLIFGMFADDSFSYVQKDDTDRKVLAIEDHIPHSLSELFAESDQVSYEQFRSWTHCHPDALVLTKWLLMEPIAFSLSSDTETPTFYQTLAGVTHLEETDISELEKKYWTLKAQSKSGRFDQETFKSFVVPTIPASLCEALFSAFDENRDNHIDFKEIACGISACCRGPTMERQKFCFKIFDVDHDGKLSQGELQEMIDNLVAIRMENKPTEELESDAFLKLDPATVSKEILSSHDSDKDGCITVEEYLVWTVNNVLCDDFLDLMSQICHVVLGLKPQTREEEGKIIQDWLNREERKKKKVGQIWYLISMQWWNSWKSYVSFQITDANGCLPQCTDSRSSSVEAPHRCLTQIRNPTSCLPWDDDTVVMVTSNKTNGLTDTSPPGDNNGTSTATGTPNKTPTYMSNTFPRTSYSANSSPRKYHLSPDVESRNRSPSASPKLRKKISIPPKPGQIDNSSLVVPNPHKVVTLTNEGGRLKREVMLVDGKDFKLVPEPVWKALSTWYGGSPALPRTVIPSSKGDLSPDLELYPVMVRLLRHQTPAQKPAQTTSFTSMVIPSSKGDLSPDLELYPVMVRLLRHQTPAQKPAQTTSFTSMVTGIGGMAINTMSSFTNNQQPKRYVAFIACFSRCHTLQQVYDFLCTKLRFNREDIRLWRISNKDENNMTLLEDESQTVEQSGVEDNQQLLIEVRNKDLTWPEEMSQIAKNKTIKKDHVPTEPGTTGLNNLGNTCFMNAAVQCVSNTRPLTKYFTAGLHLYELNRANPLGMKGHIAQRYGDLVKDMWSGSTKTTAPLKLRWTIGKYAPRFNGFQQHDSQELLSFLLDGLHEDLNRVHDKPYVELKDSDGRPDEIVAQEAWDNHLLRNQSVIVDLFHGQLKSCVRCKECDHVSVRFDPFNYLSLPLPMESCIHLEIIVMRLVGSVPVKYGLRLNMDEKYKALKRELSSLTNIPADQILLVEIMGPVVKTLPQDSQKVRNLLGGSLYAYELPPVDDIEPMTAEEESLDKKAAAKDLSDIQRGTATRKASSNGQLNKLQPLMNGGGDSNGSANNTPSHSRNNSSTSLNTSINSSTGTESLQKSVGDIFNGFVIAVHRKMTLMDLYFLSSQKTRPSLFGTPIILPCDEGSTNQDLYEFVWKQVARLVSPLPPSEAKQANHAQDCDDSLGYEYPFTLKVVQKDGFTCAWCPWYRFCRGCRLECNTEKFKFGSSFIAIDWEPTALHLRYQTTSERFFEEHGSVADSRRKQTEPIDLDTCLQAFTKEEELGEDELYYCSKCKKHCLASKKLDIWRLPPILIVNLKRFQFLNGRWVKSHKIVNFPLQQFDPSLYLAPRKHSVCKCGHPYTPPESECPEEKIPREDASPCHCDKNNPESVSPSRRKDTEDDDANNTTDVMVAEEASESNCNNNSTNTPGCHSNNNASFRHENCSNFRYDLFSMSCHTGILGGGHYVAFAKNPNHRWYCFNDSSCKEVKEGQLDSNAAYILFYQRQGLDYSTFMPGVDGRTADTQEIDDEFESDFKKLCVIQ